MACNRNPGALAVSICLLMAAARASAGVDCESLAKQRLDQVEISSAAVQPANEKVPGARYPNMTGTPGAGPEMAGLPAFCRVVGSMHPEPGSDIRFEVWLPLKGWDGRFNGANSGGLAGYVNYNDLAAAVRAGQVGAASDTGHQALPGDGTWAKGNPGKVRDYGWRAVHLTAVVGKQLTAAYYGRSPDRSYFIGCSNGGRQGLIEAARFPDDYDGIVAGAPAVAMTAVVHSFVNAVQAQLPEGAAIRPEQAKLLQDAVIAQCDASDGQVDGLVEDPRQCRFDAGKLACGVSDSPQCFSHPQIAALQQIHAGRRDTDGRVIAFGFPPSGAEVGNPMPQFGWDGGILTGFKPQTGGKSLSEGILTELAPTPIATDQTFDFDKDPARLQAALSADLDAQPDLSRFFARGGKLIMWHGWADATLPPEPTIAHYEKVLRQSGPRAKDQLRLFMVPGVQHCVGGTGPDAIGQIGAPMPGEKPERSVGAALQAWVENGRVPESIVGRRGMIAMAMKPGAPERQRLICAWPARAVLTSGADPDQASSYSCKGADAPTTSAAPIDVATAQSISDLATHCQADALQAVAASLSTTVKVKDIANGPKFAGGARFVAATEKLPAFCQVTGSFVTNPRSGKTANFLATFPANWNGKYLQMGCSGNCGQFAVSDPAQAVATITNQGLPFDTIIKGYASFATDEGHEGFAGGTWAIKGPGQVDDEAIEDLFYRAQKVLAGMGKEFTAAFYATAMKAPQKIARSYFNGCSGGGRDAFVAASYFPEQFDGTIGGSAYNGMGGAFQLAAIPVATLRSEDAVVPPALIGLIDPIVKAKCDKLDGVEDGLIQNPAACDFRAERDLPKCDGASPTGQCFTQAQIETVSTLLSAVTDEKGNIVQPGFSVSEVQAASFMTPKRPADLATRDPFPNSDSGGLGEGYWPLADAYLKVFVHKNDPDFYTRQLISFSSGGSGSVTAFHSVVPGKEVDRVRREAGVGIGHFPEKIAKLIKLDRKFLIWHNLSDQVLTPYMSINYYKQLAQTRGGYAKLQENIRLFTLPGTSHCSMGGVGPNSFDALAAMEDWVERGKAPNALLATQYPNTAMGLKDFSKPPSRTMPLCMFPQMARYGGGGDLNDAANWSCTQDDTRMLQVGESGRQAGVID